MGLIGLTEQIFDKDGQQEVRVKDGKIRPMKQNNAEYSKGTEAESKEAVNDKYYEANESKEDSNSQSNVSEILDDGVKNEKTRKIVKSV